MNKAVTAALWIARVTGVVQVVLGLTFWSGRQLALVPVHMAIGLAFVLALWTLAGLGARAGIGAVPVAFGALWGAVVLGLGVTQGSLLPGGNHWVVKLAHLVVGIIAMSSAGMLGKRSMERLHRSSPIHEPARGYATQR